MAEEQVPIGTKGDNRMNIGATKQEIQDSKKQDLKKPVRKNYAPKKEINKPIYYYMPDGKKPDRYKYPEDIYVPIENYSANLIRLLDHHLNMIKRDFDGDQVEVLVTLRSVIFPNEKGLQDIYPTHSVAVWETVQKYTRCIMQNVGKLAECVIVDICANNPDTNRICMNIALFKDEILNIYDIAYDDYVAYSTSSSYMVYNNPKNGFYETKKNCYYNPHHTSMDIGWCKKDNILDQLRTDISELNYVDCAKLQVKATLNCDNLNLEKYFLTPVIVFDFDHAYNRLKERYPHHCIYSAYNLFPEMTLQIEKYFQIIAAYVCGFTNKLNITETDLKNDKRLQVLFSTSVHQLTEKNRMIDKMGLIKLAEDAGKPVNIMV